MQLLLILINGTKTIVIAIQHIVQQIVGHAHQYFYDDIQEGWASIRLSPLIVL